jgi:hypothetical protein
MHLRGIGICALGSVGADTKCTQKLKRILRIYKSASTVVSIVQPRSQPIDVPCELLQWVDHESYSEQKTLELVQFLSEEAEPADLLRAIKVWTSKVTVGVEILPILQTVIRRAAADANCSELSGSLRRLRLARHLLKRNMSDDGYAVHGGIDDEDKPVHKIWKRMSSGIVPAFK